MKKVFGWAIAVSVIWTVPCAIKLWFEYNWLALICYAAIFIALPFVSLIHELGHVIFGSIVKIKAVPHLSPFGSSSCKLIPKTDKHLRGRLLFTALGGLAFNLIFIVAGIVGIFISECTFLCVFLPASLYLFIANAEAASLPDGKTDGLVISELISNGDSAKVAVAVLTVQAQVLNGKPIAEVEERLLFDLPVIQEDDPAFISLTELRYEYFKAKGDEERAEAYKTRLEQLKEYM